MSDELRDWSKADPDMVRFIHAQAETYLQSQFQSALASDQRATTFASILASVSAAVFAGCIALWEKAESDALAGGLVTAAILLAAAALGAWAARPIDFFMPGTRPEKWYDFRARSSIQMLGFAAEDYQHDIDENEGFMSGNQTALRYGFLLALAAPIVGVLLWWLV